MQQSRSSCAQIKALGAQGPWSDWVTDRNCCVVCRARVAERQWDDVVRAAPPPPDTRKTQLELDDRKSGKV